MRVSLDRLYNAQTRSIVTTASENANHLTGVEQKISRSAAPMKSTIDH